MKLSDAVKPISYFKAHASEIIRQISGKQKTMIITQNGEAKAIVQDIYLYDQTQESLAILKILAQSSQSLREGKTRSVKDSFKVLRGRIKEDRILWGRSTSKLEPQKRAHSPQLVEAKAKIPLVRGCGVSERI